jgi:putative oxidoreductase
MGTRVDRLSTEAILMITALPAPARDIALLAARIVLGAILIAHGVQKLFTYGIDATAAAFASLGVPAPAVSAVLAGIIELVGGAMLVLGLATAVAGLLVALAMLFAFLFVHAGNGIFVDAGGWELVGAIAAAALALAATGPGRFSADNAMAGRGRVVSA